MVEPSKRPLRVFLCHSSADKPAVRALYKKLALEGIDVWFDEEKLLPGQNWRVEIPQAVREADAIIICLTKKSVTKEGYFQTEIKFALDIVKEKPLDTVYLIPAKLEDCKVPYELRDWQWVDLSYDGKNFDEVGFGRLIRALKARAERVEANLPGKKSYSISLPRRRTDTDHEKKVNSKTEQNISRKNQSVSGSDLTKVKKLPAQSLKTIFTSLLMKVGGYFKGKPSLPSKISIRQVGVFGAIVIIIFIGGFLKLLPLSSIFNRMPTVTPTFTQTIFVTKLKTGTPLIHRTPTRTFTSTATYTAAPTFTSTPTFTKTPSATATPKYVCSLWVSPYESNRIKPPFNASFYVSFNNGVDNICATHTCTYSWSISRGGKALGNSPFFSTSASFGYTFEFAGVYDVYVSVCSDNNICGSDGISITVGK